MVNQEGLPDGATDEERDTWKGVLYEGYYNGLVKYVEGNEWREIVGKKSKAASDVLDAQNDSQ